MSEPLPIVATGATAPDLMLSFRHRDALAATLARLGRSVVAARRSAGLSARFAALGAHILIVDARDAAIEALTAVETVAADVAARGQGLIVILGEGEAEMAAAFAVAGAHQIIGAPWQDWQLQAALLLADRHRRVGPARASAIIAHWQADLNTGRLTIGSDAAPEFAVSINQARHARAALRSVDIQARRSSFSAIRRLRDGAPLAVAVQTVGDQRWVHHLTCHGTILSARVERLDANTAVQNRDLLTGLLDRMAAAQVLRERLDHRAPVAVGYVEIARLAVLNDALGHDAGDALLVRVARLLDRLLTDDIGAGVKISRCSGARFLVIGPPALAVQRLSLELRAAALSIQDAGLPEAAGTPVALRVAVGTVANANVIDAELGAIASRLATPRALVRSIDVEALLGGDQLHVLFQPQFTMADDRLIGAEALVRWQHPKLGEVAGGVLFTVAQASGHERQLSQAVWARALGAMAGWRGDLAGIRVALNATAADLADPHMPAALLGLAADHGVAASRLTLEVTEAAVIDAFDDAAAALRRLRAAGMQVALDDFGTGYSGLSWLKRLPADYIKIDASFARDVGGGPRDRAVLAGVIALAKALGLGVLAEGVEEAEQRDLLAAAGCNAYQGYLRAPALSDIDFQALVARI